MNWYDYIACLFAGMFLANVVPHFVHGISGDRFPTPFANPIGKGLSSPTGNVAWALVKSNCWLCPVLGRKGFERRQSDTDCFLRRYRRYQHMAKPVR
jgi:hypothetical protein